MVVGRWSVQLAVIIMTMLFCIMHLYNLTYFLLLLSVPSYISLESGMDRLGRRDLVFENLCAMLVYVCFVLIFFVWTDSVNLS